MKLHLAITKNVTNRGSIFGTDWWQGRGGFVPQCTLFYLFLKREEN